MSIVAAADGLQATGDELSAYRHFSNALFNAMRGGIPDQATRSRARFPEVRRGRKSHGGEVAGGALLDSLPESLPHAELLAGWRD